MVQQPGNFHLLLMRGQNNEFFLGSLYFVLIIQFQGNYPKRVGIYMHKKVSSYKEVDENSV